MNIANIVTSCRIILSALMLFSQVYSPVFYVCYLAAGFTDVIDGSIARRFGTASDFGQKLDTVADVIFVIAAAIKILPAVDISTGIIIWIGIIALIKIVNIALGILMYRQFISVHSIMNKVTGVLLFVLPLSIAYVPLKYSAIIVCAVATFAAVQEGHLIRTRHI